MASHPPKPVLSLAVGVVGHRPNRLPAAAQPTVAAQVDAVLGIIGTAARAAQQRHAADFDPAPPVLSIVDALAEGADRIVADAALARGFVLDAPLPFAADEYETDFETVASRAHYRALLARARNVLELPGERVHHSFAYERVGVTILGLSDLILAIWDGGPGAGEGGTTALMTRAVRSGQAVVHIDANGVAAPRVMWAGFAPAQALPEVFEGVPSRDLADALPSLIDALLRPPAAAAEHRNLARYLNEATPGVNLRIEFPLLQALAGVRRLSRSDLARADPAKAAARFAKSPAGRADRSGVAAAVGWSSAVSGTFAQVFRSAYVANFVLGAFAVIAAATSLLSENKVPFALCEAVFLLVILANTFGGRARDWHRRWIEPREVNERLRVSTTLWTLALRPAYFQGEEPSWTGWYARAFTRQQGMRAGALHAEGLAAARDALLALLDEQCRYNHLTAERMSKLERRLERFGLTLFVITFVLTLVHLFLGEALHELAPHDLDAELLTTVLAASLPALATASYGIRLIGDFEGIAHRAERTRQTLEQIKAAIEAEALELNVLRARARAAADVLLGDVSSWRLAAESRRLDLPG